MERKIILFLVGSLALFLALCLAVLGLIGFLSQGLEDQVRADQLRLAREVIQLRLAAPDTLLTECRDLTLQRAQIYNIPLTTKKEQRLARLQISQFAWDAASCYRDQCRDALVHEMGWKAQEQVASLALCLDIVVTLQEIPLNMEETLVLKQAQLASRRRASRDKMLDQVDRELIALERILMQMREQFPKTG